ncbi:hypothetical protein FG386_000505 [Cryptosporidium ryanae]|uniref:uncharacterized protein n=1 Tax=Cryptosporidium ryanae TaxID=515981 RepID=UPI00351A340E|nr:hypothetical protein FG386_000505 [Cryptosporidium ryanae]
MSKGDHLGLKLFSCSLFVLVMGLANSIIFDQAKMDWIFSRQADAWITKVRSYTTFYEYYPVNLNSTAESSLIADSNSAVSSLYMNYKEASSESIDVFKEDIDNIFDYFFYGFGVEISEFSTNSNQTLDENEHQHRRINRKKIMDKLRQRTQSRNNVRALKEEHDVEFPNGTFYWPNDVEKWAKISFLESGSLVNTNVSMSTYKVNNNMFNNTKEITLVFEVLEDNLFRWGGNYICEELVQEQLSKESTIAGSFVSSHVPNELKKANILAKKGQTLWYGYFVGYPNGELTKIGTFASSIPEKADERLLMHMSSRPFAFYEPFLKLGKYPDLGQYDAVISIINTQDSNETPFYLKTGTISSPRNPGLVIPPKMTGNYEGYPSRHDPYDYQDPLGPLFVPGKYCSEFLLKH